jgi:hypothetical protein
MTSQRLCPRCCRPFEPPGARSRFDNETAVCDWCGELEDAVERYGWVITGSGQWPLGIWDLLLEHMLVYEDARREVGLPAETYYFSSWHANELRPRPRRQRTR